MNSTQKPTNGHQSLALWITIVIEGLMIIAVAAYNIYEIRRSSRLVQSKIEGLAEFSARQGEKVDRMVTAIDLYVGTKLSTNVASSTNLSSEHRVEKAIGLLQSLKTGVGTSRSAGEANENQPVGSDTIEAPKAAAESR